MLTVRQTTSRNGGSSIGIACRLSALAYLGLFSLIGLVVAYIAFCDPDSCWHLALGRWMWAHCSLPLADPFSSNIQDFVFVSRGLPIMQHEWLSDCIFYGLYRLGGALLVVLFVALISAGGLIVLPSRFLLKSSTPRIFILLAMLFVVPACLFRLWARPEVISFFCFSLLITLFQPYINNSGKSRAFGIDLAAVSILLAFWTNCHALFIFGIFYPLLCTALVALQLCIDGSKLYGRRLFKVASLTLAAICGSLCSPWQFALWQYIGRIVFSGASHSNKENGPFTLASFSDLTTIPLLISLLWPAFLFVYVCLKRRPSPGRVAMPIGLYLIALACAFLYRRFTPFALLMVLSALACTCSQLRGFAPGSASRIATWLVASQRFLGRRHVPGRLAALLGLFLTLICSALAATFLVKVEIPSSSRFFQPAWQAMNYLQSHRPQGRMLNDSKFGSMMTFCLPQPPDIFIDGRFDSYSRELIGDYEWMRFARPGYKMLLDHYRIDWVFFPPSAPLIATLAADSDWSVLYKDGQAVIIGRKNTVKSKD